MLDEIDVDIVDLFACLGSKAEHRRATGCSLVAAVPDTGEAETVELHAQSVRQIGDSMFLSRCLDRPPQLPIEGQKANVAVMSLTIKLICCKAT